MADYAQVLTTVDSAEEAERLARSITTARLAACVQIIGPIRSVYWWRDKVEDAQEWQLLIKTTPKFYRILNSTSRQTTVTKRRRLSLQRSRGVVPST